MAAKKQVMLKRMKMPKAKRKDDMFDMDKIDLHGPHPSDLSKESMDGEEEDYQPDMRRTGHDAEQHEQDEQPEMDMEEAGRNPGKAHLRMPEHQRQRMARGGLAALNPDPQGSDEEAMDSESDAAQMNWREPFNRGGSSEDYETADPFRHGHEADEMESESADKDMREPFNMGGYARGGSSESYDLMDPFTGKDMAMPHEDESADRDFLEPFEDGGEAAEPSRQGEDQDDQDEENEHGKDDDYEKEKLADCDDKDLIAELKSRGYSVEKEDGEDEDEDEDESEKA